MFRLVVLPCFVLVLPVLILSSYGLVLAVDSTDVVTEANYTVVLNQNFTRAIIRGYNSACSNGGEVNPNFVSSYNNARAAGFTDIQTYWLACNGNGNHCKTYDAQIRELLTTIHTNNMEIGMIWVDMEQDSDCNNNWNYGSSGNVAQAQLLLAAMKSSNFSFGIYSTSGEWNALFGSTNFVLDNSVPLWFGNANNNINVTLDTPFGGWTSAVGHQYSLASAGPFDQSIFSS